MSARVDNWPAKLADFIEERRALPFEWGVNDCCLFACDGIRAITGLDPAAGLFRGQYHGAADAARLVQAHGGIEALAAAACARLGFAEIPAAFAQRGDVLLIDTPEHGATLGLCHGAAGLFTSPAGLQRRALEECRRAWAVGRAVAPGKGGPA